MKLYLFILLILALLIPLVNSFEVSKFDFQYAIPRNVSSGGLTFNQTEFWITNEGNMDNVPDLYPTLDLRYILPSQVLANFLSINGSNANQDIDIQGFNLTTIGWFLPSHLRAVTYHSTGANLPFNFYDDGSNIILNMTSVEEEFTIETDNTKITLFNEPKSANDFKVMQIFSKEASDITEFVVTKAGEEHTSYFIRSLAITGNATTTPTPFNCSTFANFIDCNTDITGADLYVQDDLEVNGSIFTGNIIVSGNITADYGFFNSLGTLLKRIKNIFFINAVFNGTINDVYWNTSLTDDVAEYNLYLGGVDGTESLATIFEFEGDVNVTGNISEGGQLLEDKYEPKSSAGNMVMKFTGGKFYMKVS